MVSGGTDILATVEALSTYTRTVLPHVRAERVRWMAQASSIPDPVLRAQALGSLKDKGRNIEGTAVFATLAPRAARPRVVGAITALQIAVDYLDSLGETDVDDPLGDGLQLHRALLGVVDPDAGSDPYRLHPHGEDGGYLAALVRRTLAAASPLPGWQTCAPHLWTAISRCGEGQAQTHSAHLDDGAALRSWGEGLTGPPGYQWWERAAGASSSVAAHALLALAGNRGALSDAPGLVDAAYFPSIGALTVLLDDLIDLDEDLGVGQHNYVPYYRDEREVAGRLGLLTEWAEATIAVLPHHRRHRAILAGVMAFYLSDPAAGAAHARPTRDRLLGSSGVPTRILASFSRLRRRAQT